MSTAESRIEHREQMKADWAGQLDALFTRVKAWAEAAGWSGQIDRRSVTEPELGRFDVPLLVVKRAGTEVVFSPIARVDETDDGNVDVCLMPGYSDVVSLRREGDGWYLRDAWPPDSTAPSSSIRVGRRPVAPESILWALDAASAYA